MESPPSPGPTDLLRRTAPRAHSTWTECQQSAAAAHPARAPATAASSSLHPDPSPLPAAGFTRSPPSRVRRHRGAHTRTAGPRPRTHKAAPSAPRGRPHTWRARPQPPEPRARRPRRPRPLRARSAGCPRRPGPGGAGPTRIGSPSAAAAGGEQGGSGGGSAVRRVPSAEPVVWKLSSPALGNCPRRLLGNKGARRGRRAQGTRGRGGDSPPAHGSFWNMGPRGGGEGRCGKILGFLVY